MEKIITLKAYIEEGECVIKFFTYGELEKEIVLSANYFESIEKQIREMLKFLEYLENETR